MSYNLKNIDNEKDLIKLMKENSNVLTLIKFSTSKNLTCQKIVSWFNDMAMKKLDVFFINVDYDIYADNKKTLKSCIDTFPTFYFYHNGKKLATTKGFEPNEIKNGIEQCQNYINNLNKKAEDDYKTQNFTTDVPMEIINQIREMQQMQLKLINEMNELKNNFNNTLNEYNKIKHETKIIDAMKYNITKNDEMNEKETKDNETKDNEMKNNQTKNNEMKNSETKDNETKVNETQKNENGDVENEIIETRMSEINLMDSNDFEEKLEKKFESEKDKIDYDNLLASLETCEPDFN